VQERYEDIRREGGEVLVVSFTRPDKLAAYVQRHALPFPAVADPERDAYRAFALSTGSWWMFLRGQVIGRYLRLMARGWLPEKTAAADDLLQLGGDFVLDGQRRLVYAYRSKDATDRPAAEDLVQAVGRAAATV
jgi:peroxiredoxin